MGALARRADNLREDFSPRRSIPPLTATQSAADNRKVANILVESRAVHPVSTVFRLRSLDL
ncbi:MAG TPA: hypothetical protein VG297_17275 [Bryobacteraceae bacterium]|nr:hypothetical protein [Bryobacteraceae bacterium]